MNKRIILIIVTVIRKVREISFYSLIIRNHLAKLYSRLIEIRVFGIKAICYSNFKA